MTTIHFHGGPLAGGEQQHEGKPPHEVVVRASSDDGDITVYVGRYVPDPDSAGGRCYDWQAGYQ